MRLFEHCLLASDIDETLMHRGQLPERNIERIRYFIEQGGKFAVATGRSVSELGPVVAAIPELAPSAIANGCVVYDFGQQRVLGTHTVPQEDRWVIEEILALGRDIGLLIEYDGRMTVVCETQEIIDTLHYVNVTADRVTYDEIRDKPWYKAVLMFKNEDDYAAAKAIAARRPLNSSFVNTGVFIGGRMRHHYELLPHGVNKGTALRELCTILHIAPGCCYAIGDYYNDLEMIRAADIGAATSGALEEIRQQANFITGPAELGAVADFIDYLTEVRKGCME